MKKIPLLTFFLVLILGCRTVAPLKYIPDLHYVSPAAANSPELLVLLNGVVCADLSGAPGLCALRAVEGSTINLQIPGQAYAYDLSLVCSDSTGFTQKLSSLSENILSIPLAVPSLAVTKSFTCIGELFPSDRPQPISSRFEFRVKIVAADYQALERPHYQDGFLVLGSHSLHAYVQDSGVWQYYHKVPDVKVIDPTAPCIVESASGRRTYCEVPHE